MLATTNQRSILDFHFFPVKHVPSDNEEDPELTDDDHRMELTVKVYDLTRFFGDQASFDQALDTRNPEANIPLVAESDSCQLYECFYVQLEPSRTFSRLALRIRENSSREQPQTVLINNPTLYNHQTLCWDVDDHKVEWTDTCMDHDGTSMEVGV